MITLSWVYYFCIVATLFQIVSKLISYDRTRLRSRLYFGIPAFGLVTLGFILAQISIGPHPIVPRATLIIINRIIFLSVALLWGIEGVFDLHSYIVVEGGWGAVWRLVWRREPDR